MLLRKISGAFRRPQKVPKPSPGARIRTVWLGDSARNTPLMGLDRQRVRHFRDGFILAGGGTFVDPTWRPEEEPPEENHFFLPIRFTRPFLEAPLMSCFLRPRAGRQQAEVSLQARYVSQQSFVLVLRGGGNLGHVLQEIGWIATGMLALNLLPSDCGGVEGDLRLRAPGTGGER